MSLLSSVASAVLFQPVLRPATDPVQRAAFQRLSGLSEQPEIRAVVLALILTPESEQELRGWEEATRDVASAAELLNQVRALAPTVRVTLLTSLLHRLSMRTRPDRVAFRRAARQLMCADGLIRPIDRLYWLLICHLTRNELHEDLADESGAVVPAHPVGPVRRFSRSLRAFGGAFGKRRARTGLGPTDLSVSQRIAVLDWTAYLVRLHDGTHPVGTNPGQDWYLQVIDAILCETLTEAGVAALAVGPRSSPDGDRLVVALHELQSLPESVRVRIVETWVRAFRRQSSVPAPAVEAMRIVCCLLGTPIPARLEALEFAATLA
jgi:hypothetical protein